MDPLSLKQQYDELVTAIENVDEYWVDQDKHKPNDISDRESHETLLAALKTFSFVCVSQVKRGYFD